MNGFVEKKVVVEKTVYEWEDDQTIDPVMNAWTGSPVTFIFPVMFLVIMLVIFFSN